MKNQGRRNAACGREEGRETPPLRDAGAKLTIGHRYAARKWGCLSLRRGMERGNEY